MGSGDFFDEPMGSQQSELAGDGGGPTFKLLLGGLSLEEEGPQIAISKSVEGEFSPVDGLQQSGVLWRPGIERSKSAVVAPEGFADFLNPLEEGDFAAGGREGCQVALIGSMGHLGSTLEVSDAS